MATKWTSAKDLDMSGELRWKPCQVCFEDAIKDRPCEFWMYDWKFKWLSNSYGFWVFRGGERKGNWECCKGAFFVEKPSAFSMEKPSMGSDCVIGSPMWVDPHGCGFAWIYCIFGLGLGEALICQDVAPVLAPTKYFTEWREPHQWQWNNHLSVTEI